MTMSRRVLIVWITALIMSGATAQAATVTATSCSTAAVQAAINSAVNGDTVVIPNGSCTWTSGVTMTKQIIVSGETKGGVTITHSAGDKSLFTVTTGPTFNSEIRNLTFLVTSGEDG